MAVKDISGKVYIVGDDIDTDAIIPAKYLVTTDHKELASHAMEGLDEKLYPQKMLDTEGNCGYKIIIAGKNFGCGSSREHAPIALYSAGIEAVIAPTFARIFYRNCINGGQMYALAAKDIIVKTPGKKAKKRDKYAVNSEDGCRLRTGDILNVHIGEDDEPCWAYFMSKTAKVPSDFSIEPLPEFVHEIYEAGGLMAYSVAKMKKKEMSTSRRCCHH